MSNVAGAGRWAWAEVDLDAVRHNVAELRKVVAPTAVWAVVKADGYGHGAVPVARAALEAGAEGLCVALVDEGLRFRDAGLPGPILVLSEQPPAQLGEAIAAGLTLTVASRDAIAAAANAARSAASAASVHLKVDTGMHRVGAPPEQTLSLAQSIIDAHLRLDGVFTHLAVADEPDDPFTSTQLDRFDDVLFGLRQAGIDPGLVHAANSAGALAHPRAHHRLVRAGIALYGISPGTGVDGAAARLSPALSLRARVSAVRRVPAGDRISYGLRHQFPSDTTVVVLPLGYADGVPRRSFQCGVEVLVGGRRCPIVGTVTMDQLMIDVGDDAVSVGDEVVLIGRQGDRQISASEWAQRLGTIGYEITCGISARVPRVPRPPSKGLASGCDGDVS